MREGEDGDLTVFLCPQGEEGEDNLIFSCYVDLDQVSTVHPPPLKIRHHPKNH